MASADARPAIDTSSKSGPRNLPRASLACERCRAKKAKCDQRQPCSQCVRYAAQCRYGVSKRGLRPRRPPQPPQGQQIEAISAQVEVTSAPVGVSSSVPSIGEMPEGSLREIADGDEIGDVNERTHGMEFYGTSSNHVLLNQLFSFVRNNRRHGQLHVSTSHPGAPSSLSGQDEAQAGDPSANGCQQAERPSAVNLLSIEDPLCPPSRRETPPPTSHSRRPAGGSQEAISTRESRSANTASLPLASSNSARSSHLQSPSWSSGDGVPLGTIRHRLERELVRSFLHNLHYLHPMLDSTEFVEQCDTEVWSFYDNARRSAKRRHFMALFHIVVAVGALVAGREVGEEFSREIIAIEQSRHRPPTPPQQVSLRTLSRSYFLEARALLGDVFEVCSLESAQTLLLMVSLVPSFWE